MKSLLSSKSKCFGVQTLNVHALKDHPLPVLDALMPEIKCYVSFFRTYAMANLMDDLHKSIFLLDFLAIQR